MFVDQLPKLLEQANLQIDDVLKGKPVGKLLAVKLDESPVAREYVLCPGVFDTHRGRVVHEAKRTRSVRWSKR